MGDELARLDGASSSVVLDRRAQTLTFEHHGSVITAEQKALSPLVIPLGAIASVEAGPGRSTNWFWVVRRGREPWSGGVWSDPCGVVCGDDPSDFADLVRSAVAEAAPADDVVDDVVPEQAGGWPARFGKGLVRGMVDGFFNTR